MIRHGIVVDAHALCDAFHLKTVFEHQFAGLPFEFSRVIALLFHTVHLLKLLYHFSLFGLSSFTVQLLRLHH